MTSPGTLAARRDAAFGRGAALFYDRPLHIVKGEGVHLIDADGRRYVDMYNNVPCVGHCHPKVVAAITRQAGTLNVHSRYIHEGAIALAERLTSLHGPQIESVVFSCSGTEANEVAIRAARFVTGRRGVVCTNATYHGNSELVGALTHVGRSRPETGTVSAFPFPERLRPIRPGLSEDALCEAYLEQVGQAIGRLEASGAGLAALIVCSIMANEGLPDIPRGFMARASDLVHRAGGLVIADEVQAGYGRTGTWWGYEAEGFVPDIVTTGKPMGNGVPVAATAASRTIVETFREKTRYFNTFAASPLQAAAAHAVLDVIAEEDLIAQVAEVGGQLKADLAARDTSDPRIGDIRGRGLFIGIEIIRPDDGSPDPDMAFQLSNRLRDNGFLTSNAGIFRNVLKLRPPLVFTHENARDFLDAWDRTLRSVDVRTV